MKKPSSNIARIAKKELTLFFSSAIGYLFLALFVGVTLGWFFWGAAFFARNIADVRPMFAAMPVLLLFLSAALTMRMWSEERRAGTLEFVMTVPVSTWSFVIGKFLACWTLLVIALLLTLPLPISVALLGPLDWGPVWAGYLAAVLLGAAYIAVGLFVSSRSDNQIVSLLLAVLACSVLYLIGSPMLTELVTMQAAEWMRSLGTGARFESITRGVIDFRDLYYYTSIVAVFLALNVYALQREGWARDGSRPHHRGWRAGTALLVLNVLVANVWLVPLTAARVDVTEGRIYSISDASRAYLDRLQEPLLIRGYFSAKTHPLLAPLVPQIQDLMTEFAVAGGGRVRVEFVDPARSPELEDEANTRYGIRPVPFQVADRHQASLVNAYFDVLLEYGDEHVVLSFRDLIEVKSMGETSLDVRLRNPEYDLIRGVRKVLYGFQSGGDLFESLPGPITFRAYVSHDSALPRELVAFRQDVASVLDTLADDAGDKLRVEWVDPMAGSGETARRIEDEFGFRPMFASLFDQRSFYFYLMLTDGERQVHVPLPEELDAESFRRTLDGEVRRFAPGYLRTVALVAPETNAFMGPFGGGGGSQYTQLAEVLGADLNLVRTNLNDGRVPAAAEVLILVDPEELSDQALFAVDQFLMQGGTVFIAAAPFSTELTQVSLEARPRTTGLEDWLAHHGVTVTPAFVMDPSNSAFPLPVTREVGGFQFQELRMLDYPYFVDVRGDGLNAASPITANLPQITLPWAAPLVVDTASADGRTVTPLITSSPLSWTSEDTDIMPRVDQRGGTPYRAEGEQGPRVLGVLLEGRFDSYFANRPNPLLANGAANGAAAGDATASAEDNANGDTSETDSAGVITSIVTRSPESARLFVFGSNEFLSDQSLSMIGAADGTFYTNTLQLVSNAVDWSLEDRDLLTIRGRSHFGRTLPPLTAAEQQVWEYANYGAALFGLGIVFLIHRGRNARRRRKYKSWLV